MTNIPHAAILPRREMVVTSMAFSHEIVRLEMIVHRLNVFFPVPIVVLDDQDNIPLDMREGR
jgi:hypothetical protein